MVNRSRSELVIWLANFSSCSWTDYPLFSYFCVEIFLREPQKQPQILFALQNFCWRGRAIDFSFISFRLCKIFADKSPRKYANVSTSKHLWKEGTQHFLLRRTGWWSFIPVQELPTNLAAHFLAFSSQYHLPEQVHSHHQLPVDNPIVGSLSFLLEPPQSFLLCDCRHCNWAHNSAQVLVAQYFFQMADNIDNGDSEPYDLPEPQSPEFESKLIAYLESLPKDSPPVTLPISKKEQEIIDGIWKEIGEGNVPRCFEKFDKEATHTTPTQTIAQTTEGQTAKPKRRIDPNSDSIAKVTVARIVQAKEKIQYCHKESFLFWFSFFWLLPELWLTDWRL